MATIEVVSDPNPRCLEVFDAVIDVRSPMEFDQDHLPGAINLPVLGNEERALVGSVYVQESKFQARRIGAALVARNVAHHLEGPLAEKPGSFRPLIYCWRGGQRSAAMATILSQVGWRTAVLTGGYKTYRKYVREQLHEQETSAKLVLLDGRTGSGKTTVLRRLRDEGLQVLDLEALAQHRGSLFGALDAAQPSQKLFESRLLATLSTCDLTRPILVEAEASKIGDRALPAGLWKVMLRAPKIVLKAPASERARYLAMTYSDVGLNLPRIREALARLPLKLSVKTRERWQSLAKEGALEPLAAQLIKSHYDPAYDRVSRRGGAILDTIAIPDLEPRSIDLAVERVAELVSQLR
jgi:tRNA 2-selenouridine synthase